jgi:hypothetical protein
VYLSGAGELWIFVENHAVHAALENLDGVDDESGTDFDKFNIVGVLFFFVVNYLRVRQ